ncbi:MAG TPA: hypothetical protein VI094_11770, partial [Propionibacteriaceae bacterium]
MAPVHHRILDTDLVCGAGQVIEKERGVTAEAAGLASASVPVVGVGPVEVHLRPPRRRAIVRLSTVGWAGRTVGHMLGRGSLDKEAPASAAGPRLCLDRNLRQEC